MKENDIYTISRINNLIDKKISYCDDFRKIKIRGEITNFNGSYNSGHYYFSLKDKKSSISCVMFKLSTKSLDFKPKDGMDVVATGEVSFYKARGNLQFRVRKMQEAGLGDLYIAFEKLKKKLAEEGLFKDKKAIPQYPKKIGVITSASGKAIKDIVNNIEKRWPAEIVIWDTTVQGANSARSITKNISLANKTDVDMIIVGRGGGSTQDLWDFNKEEVVRSIANSEKPVITAIGHSTDKTLSDLASDKVAATPTKSAELAVPNKVEINEKLKNIETRLNDLINSKLDNLTHRISISKNNKTFKDPLSKYKNHHTNLLLLKTTADKSLNQLIQSNELQLDGFNNSYVLNNPEYILDKKVGKINLFKNELYNNITSYILACENKVNLCSENLKYLNLSESFELKNNSLDLIENNLNNSINNKLNFYTHNFEIIKNNHVFTNPCQILDDKSDRITEINKSLDSEITKILNSNENKLKILEEKLKILNPEELLEKGYVVKDPEEIRKSKAKNVIIIIFLAVVIVLLILLSLK